MGSEMCIRDRIQTATGPEETPASVYQKTQKTVDAWEQGLSVGGGALKPDKSFWYAIEFDWGEDDDWRLKKASEINAELSVMDHTGTRVVLEKLDPDTAKETLGVELCPAACMAKQIETMTVASLRQ